MSGAWSSRPRTGPSSCSTRPWERSACFVDLIARRIVSGPQRALIVIGLMLLPAYQFLAHRFNANCVLLPLWPLATCFFLQSLDSRKATTALLLGLTCALAGLGKYYSGVLLLGFAAAAVAHPQRRRYFRSIAPWLSRRGVLRLARSASDVAAQNDSTTSPAHIGNDTIASLRDSAAFIAGNIGYLVLPFIVLCLTRDPANACAAGPA